MKLARLMTRRHEMTSQLRSPEREAKSWGNSCLATAMNDALAIQDNSAGTNSNDSSLSGKDLKRNYDSLISELPGIGWNVGTSITS